MSINYLDELDEYLDRFPKYKIRGNKLISCSPFREDKSPSFAVNLDNGTFIDSGSTDSNWHKGTFYKLITFFTGETPQEAFKRINKELNIDIGNITLDINLKPLNKPLNALERVVYNKDSLYLKNRGICSAIQKMFNVAEENNLIKFPVYAKNNYVVNIKYRKINNKVFWYDSDGEPIKQYLYGLNVAKTSNTVYVVEGEVDVMSMFELGLPCVGTFGASFTEKQIELILNNFSNVVIIPDNDTVGMKHSRRLIDKLFKHVDVGECVLPKQVKDINDFLNIEPNKKNIVEYIRKNNRRERLCLIKT